MVWGDTPPGGDTSFRAAFILCVLHHGSVTLTLDTRKLKRHQVTSTVTPAQNPQIQVYRTFMPPPPLKDTKKHALNNKDMPRISASSAVLL